MDTADRFINNRTPRRVVMISLLLLAVMTAVSFLVSDYIAGIITSEHIRSLAAAAGGYTDFLSVPDEEAVAAGDAVISAYGITSDSSVRLFGMYKKIRTSVFISMEALSAVLCVSGAAISLVPLFRMFREMEIISEECKSIAEKGGELKCRYGDTFSSLRRISEGINRIGKSMDYNISALTADREFLRDFLADFSHQLKTSIAVVRLNNDMLDSLDNLTEEKADQLSAEINFAIEDMESLVFSALKLAKLKAGSVKYEKHEGSLADICRKALQKTGPLLKSKNIEYTAELKNDVNYSVDDIWLTEAVANLIKNSADHSGCTEIKISVSENPQTAVVSVSDNGRGIPQSAIPGIFERFGKVSRSSGMSSVGIGMSIAEKIVREHNGEILVFSGEGTGTRFELVFLK